MFWTEVLNPLIDSQSIRYESGTFWFVFISSNSICFQNCYCFVFVLRMNEKKKGEKRCKLHWVIKNCKVSG